jgi:uncharacterized protein (TIGR01370 family)
VSFALVTALRRLLGRSSDRFANFQYQLQNERYEDIFASPAKLIVVDIDDSSFTKQQVAAISEGKALLSYLSIGQASDKRWYWDPAWVDIDGDPIDGQAPSWLGERNGQWPGAYEVRFWEAGWRDILIEGMNRILDRGYGGVVYDVVDAYATWDEPAAAARMRALVIDLMKYGRAKKDGYIGIPNSGYPLLRNEEYFDSISGQLCESVFYYGGAPRPPNDTKWATDYLDPVIARGKPVFNIEYGIAWDNRKAVVNRARARGYVPYMAATQKLDTLEPVWQEY